MTAAYRESRGPAVFEGEYRILPAPESRLLLGAPVFATTVAAGLGLLHTTGYSIVDAFVFVVAVAGALACFGIRLSWSSWVHVTPREIAWGRSERLRGSIPWEEVASVRFRLGHFRVLAVDGRAVTVGVSWTDAAAFARAVLALVPPERITGARTRAALDVARARGARRVASPTIGEYAEEEGASAALARWHENPFFVLGLRPDCTRGEAERAGEKLLALLTVGASAAKTYPTPFGPRARTADHVRAALAELRDPSRRVVHELWARATNAEAAPHAEPAKMAWTGAMRAAGWRQP